MLPPPKNARTPQSFETDSRTLPPPKTNAQTPQPHETGTGRLGGAAAAAADQAAADQAAADQAAADEAAVLLEANVDDLDPRLWPGVLAGLLAAGADDAWLVPIVMKKGRPAHTLTALCAPGAVDAVRARIFRDTSTLGVRASDRRKTVLPRTVAEIAVAGTSVRIKIGHAGGVVVQVMPEFADVAALAAELGIAERVALTRAVAAAAEAGIVVGARLLDRNPASPGNPVR
jgi:hypothetical protein